LIHVTWRYIINDTCGWCACVCACVCVWHDDTCGVTYRYDVMRIKMALRMAQRCASLISVAPHTNVRNGACTCVTLLNYTCDITGEPQISSNYFYRQGLEALQVCIGLFGGRFGARLRMCRAHLWSCTYAHGTVGYLRTVWHVNDMSRGHKWKSRVSRVNESWHTYERVISVIWNNHVI